MVLVVVIFPSSEYIGIALLSLGTTTTRFIIESMMVAVVFVQVDGVVERWRLEMEIQR